VRRTEKVADNVFWAAVEKGKDGKDHPVLLFHTRKAVRNWVYLAKHSISPRKLRVQQYIAFKVGKRKRGGF